MSLAIAVISLPACGGESEGSDGASAQGRVEAALRDHIEAMAGDNQDMIDAGPLESVSCRLFGADFRGEPVFYCEAEHRSVIADWCAALVDGNLYTHNSVSELPCVARTQPTSPEQ